MIESGLYQNKTTAHLAKCRCRLGMLALYNSILSDQKHRSRAKEVKLTVLLTMDWKP
jgi:hypothetical protein